MHVWVNLVGDDPDRSIGGACALKRGVKLCAATTATSPGTCIQAEKSGSGTSA